MNLAFSKSARISRGMFYSFEALLGVLAAVALVALLSITTKSPGYAPNGIDEYRLAQDFAEASFRNPNFRRDLLAWLETGDTSVRYWEEVVSKETGACVWIESKGIVIFSSNCVPVSRTQTTASVTRLFRTVDGFTEVRFTLRT